MNSQNPDPIPSYLIDSIVSCKDAFLSCVIVTLCYRVYIPFIDSIDLFSTTS